VARLSALQANLSKPAANLFCHLETDVSGKLINRRVQVAKSNKEQSALTAAIRALAPVLTAVIRVGGQIMVAWIRYARH